MRSLSCAAVLALAGCLVAQAGDAQPASASRPALDQIVARHKQAMDRFVAARKEVFASDAYKKAAEAKDREAMARLVEAVPAPDWSVFGKQALDAAAKLRGEEQVPLLAWALLKSNDKESATAAADQLRAHHLHSKQLLSIVENGSALLRALGQEGANEFFAAVAKDSPQSDIRAWAIYWPASMVGRNRNASDEDKATADARIQEARQLAGDGSLLADRIDAPKFAAEHLQIGMPAPEITGEDMDGEQFKLSDYRGKVVVLDFWGYW